MVLIGNYFYQYQILLNCLFLSITDFFSLRTMLSTEEESFMTLVLTQSDFRANLKKYLDQVNDDDETVYVARSNNRAVAIISQEKMD